MKALDELREYLTPQKDGSLIVSRCSRLFEFIDAIEAELAERYMELPLDADGEVIHIGDVVENLREDLEPSLHHRLTVYGIHYYDYEQECAITEDGFPSILYRASELRHHHEPTVEDVLAEFADRVCNSGHQWGLDAAATIAEYAAKLRLAGEVE